jgi:hypothetical protein
MFEVACVKAFTKKVGANKTKLTMLAPLTPALARGLKIHSLVYTQDNTPKPELLEIKLNVAEMPTYKLRLEVQGVPTVLDVQCDAAVDWIARQKGSTRKGKPSKLVVEFKAVFSGAAIGVFEWIEKYGGAAGILRLASVDPEQADLALQDPPPKGKSARAGRVQ